MRKSGVLRAFTYVLAAGLVLGVASNATRPASASQAADNQKPEVGEYEVPTIPIQAESKANQKVEVIDLSVQEVPLQREVDIHKGLTDGFLPGSVEPSTASATAVSRTLQWALGELIVESSEVTASGFVEYTLRGTLRGDSARATAAEVVAAARAVSPEVSVVSESLHFTVHPCDDLDTLSRDAIRVRVRGGLTFEPSMLRWTFLALLEEPAAQRTSPRPVPPIIRGATSACAAPQSAEQESQAAAQAELEASVINPLNDPDPQYPH